MALSFGRQSALLLLLLLFFSSLHLFLSLLNSNCIVYSSSISVFCSLSEAPNVIYFGKSLSVSLLLLFLSLYHCVIILLFLPLVHICTEEHRHYVVHSHLFPILYHNSTRIRRVVFIHCTKNQSEKLKIWENM